MTNGIHCTSTFLLGRQLFIYKVAVWPGIERERELHQIIKLHAILCQLWSWLYSPCGTSPHRTKTSFGYFKRSWQILLKSGLIGKMKMDTTLFGNTLFSGGIHSMSTPNGTSRNIWPSLLYSTGILSKWECQSVAFSWRERTHMCPFKTYISSN